MIANISLQNTYCFTSSLDSGCNSDYNPDVSSWATRESYLLKVLNKWLNWTHDYRVEIIYLQSSSFSHIPIFPAESFNLQMKAWKDSIIYNVLNYFSVYHLQQTIKWNFDTPENVVSQWIIKYSTRQKGRWEEKGGDQRGGEKQS